MKRYGRKAPPGNLITSVGRVYPRFSREEEARLAWTARFGPPATRSEAREKLIMSCVPLAARVSFEFSGKGIEDDDLLQTAMLALVHAVDCFEPWRKQGRLSTFVVFLVRLWLRGHVWERSRPIRLPPYNGVIQNRSNAAKASRVRQCWDVPERVEELSVKDDDVADAELREKQRSFFHEALSTLLPVRTAEILRMRLDGMTHREIGMVFGLSRQRIKQIIDDALNRIRRAWNAGGHRAN